MSVGTQTEASGRAAVAGAALGVTNLEVVYHDLLLVLRGVSLEVPSGAVVALLGANGAGKTTLLRAITGLLDLHRGKITKGAITVDGRPIHKLPAAAIVRGGVAQVMEGRRIFADLTVDENLRTGAATRRDRSAIKASYERVLELFPKLAERRRQTAGYLSGGEQQMVAMGRALMADPKLLVLDEPSLGLAPLIVEQVREIITTVNDSGTSVLLVEQNAAMALSIADHGYVLENGRIVKEGPGPSLLADADIQEFYLGVGEAGRRSLRDVKTYRRRKRWGA
ncbi:MAG TPA: ABC transporter ATP-binding protein [Acidimicrobiales bacterium]|jgi:branched-chain amino acid transport system ATP-binding protein|nr:ABC transporter ATP-binding protein [Acidimicrobiales bacterium]